MRRSTDSTQGGRTRRTFLALAGAGATALAGCAGLRGSGGSTKSGASGGSATGKSGGASSTSLDSAGTLDDFEDLGRWQTLGGSVTADTQQKQTGSQSARVEAKKSERLGGIARSVDGLDLSKFDLSAAVKLEQPAEGSIRRIAAVAVTSGGKVVMKRYLGDTLDEWVRVDFGVTSESGDPDPSKVKELRLMVVAGEETPVKFWVDDLQLVPKPEEAYAIFGLDNTRGSHYDTAFQVLQEKGYPAVEGVNPRSVGGENYLSLDELREMRDAGWDIASQPQTADPLPAYEKAKQRQIIEDAHSYLQERGLGGEHFLAPYHQLSGETLDILADVHETGFTFGAAPTPLGATGQYTISRVNGDSRKGLRKLGPLAKKYNQTVTMYFPEIKEGGDMDEPEFREVVGIIEDAGLKPITATTFQQKLKQLQG